MDWLLNLPVVWMAVVILTALYAVAGVIYVVATRLAVGERARAFKAVSPGMLPPLAIVFALLVGFLAAQVWSDADRAGTAVNREASALRVAVLLFVRDRLAPYKRPAADRVRRAAEDHLGEYPASRAAKAGGRAGANGRAGSAGVSGGGISRAPGRTLALALEDRLNQGAPGGSVTTESAGNGRGSGCGPGSTGGGAQAITLSRTPSTALRAIAIVCDASGSVPGSSGGNPVAGSVRVSGMARSGSTRMLNS